MCSAMLGKQNLAAVLHGAMDLRLDIRPMPVPRDDEVLLEMAFVGICGSDVHFYKAGHIGEFVVEQPMVCGHEGSGVVVQTGKAVTSLKPGDRVGIEPGVHCRRCQLCKQGTYNLCRDMAFCACPPTHGNLARFFTHPADMCFKLPENVTLEEGALLEPLAVGVQACSRAAVAPGSHVLITGSGPIGIVTLFVAKAMGASVVTMTDVVETRVALARSMGADHALLVAPDADGSVVAAEVRAVSGREVDITIDCSGFESALQLAMHATKPAGTVILVGLGDACDVKVPLIQALFKQLDVRGTFRYANAYPRALALAASKKVQLERFITHRFQLEDSIEAFETASSCDALKVIIRCSRGKEPSKP